MADETSLESNVKIAATSTDALANSQVDSQTQAAQPQATETLSAQNSGNTLTAPASNNGNNAQASNEWLITLDKFSLSNYDINLTEQLVTKTPQQWRVFPVNLSTQTVTSDLATPLVYDVSAVVNDKGRLASQGEVQINEQVVTAKVSVEQLDLSQFQPYLAPYVNIMLQSGTLSTQGELNANAQGKAIYQGQAGIDDLLIKDNTLNETLTKWRTMSINSLTFDKQANSLNIDHLAFDALFGKMIIAKDRSTNIGDLNVDSTNVDSPNVDNANSVSTETTPASSTQASKDKANLNKTETKASTVPAASPGNAADFALNINKISFTNSSAYFADNSLTPNFASGIEQLEGEITKLSSTPGTKASVDIKGKIDKYAPVSLKGDINPLLKNPYLNLDLQFKSVELTSINPYSGTYAGYYIDKGQLSLALNYELDNNQLKGSNHLVIDQLKLGKPSDSSLATSLPITLAIALLQDRHGVIDLGLEVQGDVDSPSFSIASIVFNAIANVITKAVTAPFSLLAGLIGSDDELDQVDFQAGVALISTDEQDKLSKLAKALDERPKLTLSVEGSVEAVTDSKMLGELQIQAQAAKLANMTPEQLPQDLTASTYPIEGPLSDALMSLYRSNLSADPNEIKDKILADNADKQLTENDINSRWHIAIYNLLVNSQDISEDQLGTLAQTRAKNVKAYLVENLKVPPEKVFLLDSRFKTDHDASIVKLTLSAN